MENRGRRGGGGTKRAGFRQGTGRNSGRRVGNLAVHAACKLHLLRIRIVLWGQGEKSIMNNIKIIGAGAGTGKTFRLSQEVSDAVLKRGVQPENIIIMTFTRKAASELLSRVGQTLIKNGAPREANLLRQALIGTINGVCGSLLERLRSMPGLQCGRGSLLRTKRKCSFPRQCPKQSHLSSQWRWRNWIE